MAALYQGLDCGSVGRGDWTVAALDKGLCRCSVELLPIGINHVTRLPEIVVF